MYYSQKIFIFNGKFYGGFVKAAPHADMTDGYLDVYLFKKGEKKEQSDETTRAWWDAMVNVWTLYAYYNIEMEKECDRKCCKFLKAVIDYRFKAKDTMDFNPGDWFAIPPLYVISDDLVNQCKLGKDFEFFAMEWQS